MKQLKWLLSHFEEMISGVGFIVMVGSTSANVISRYCLGKSFAWSEEVTYLGFAYTICMGIAFLYKKNAMIAVDVLVSHMPPKIQHAFNLFNYFILLVANLFLFYLSVKLAAGAVTRFTTALRMPYTVIDTAAVLAFALTSFYSVRFLYWLMRGREIAGVSLEDQR